MPRLQPREPRSAHLQLLAVAWNFGWPVAAGVGLGHWLDQHFGTSPGASLVLGIGALAAAAIRLIRLSRRQAEDGHGGSGNEEELP